MSRVYLLAAGPRGWPRETLGDVCQVAPGPQESGREALPRPLWPPPPPSPARPAWERRGRLPPLCSPGLCDGCDSPCPPLPGVSPEGGGDPRIRVAGSWSRGRPAAALGKSGDTVSGGTAWQSHTAGEGTPAGPSPKATSRMRPEQGLRSLVVCFMLTRLGRHVPRPDLGEEGRKPEPRWAVPGPRVPLSSPARPRPRPGQGHRRSRRRGCGQSPPRSALPLGGRGPPFPHLSGFPRQGRRGQPGSCRRAGWDDPRGQSQTGLRRQVGHSSAPGGTIPPPPQE